jgi:hypothetical protein
MLVRNVFLNEGRRDEQFLAMLASEFPFTLLSDVWFCGKHDFPVNGELRFIKSDVVSMNGPTLADLFPRNLEDPRRPC